MSVCQCPALSPGAVRQTQLCSAPSLAAVHNTSFPCIEAVGSFPTAPSSLLTKHPREPDFSNKATPELLGSGFELWRNLMFLLT